MSLKARRIGLTVVVAALALGVEAWLPSASAGSSPAAVTNTDGQQVVVTEAGPMEPMDNFGMQLAPGPPNPAVSEQQAVADAVKFTVASPDGQQVFPNVAVNAEYGSFSDPEMGTKQADGAFRPWYQNKPVWLITFSGQGVLHYGLGGSYVPEPGGRQPSHEETLVIDATTGAYLIRFS